MTAPSAVNLGYYWGDDDYELERAADALGQRLEAAAGGERMERWRMRGDARTVEDASERIARILERVGTTPFFGGGTLVIVAEPAGLARWKQDGPSIADLVGIVAPGNGLAFVDTLDEYGKRRAGGEALGRVVSEAGGEVRQVRAPREGQMVRWIEERAAERGMRLGRGAGQELANRIGAFVRENDVDRRRQGSLAASELEKLRLYRPSGEVTIDDVRALVPEAIPGSTWAFLDAVAMRQSAAAASLAVRLLDSTPPPVLVTVLHRRVRELIMVSDLLVSGLSQPEIMRSLRMHEFVVRKLAAHSRNWTAPELDAALDGLLELDVALKGADGATAGDAQFRLLVAAWLADHVGRH